MLLLAALNLLSRAPYFGADIDIIESNWQILFGYNPEVYGEGIRVGDRVDERADKDAEVLCNRVMSFGNTEGPRLLLNDGSGSFTEAATASLSNAMSSKGFLSMFAADVDNDGGARAHTRH